MDPNSLKDLAGVGAIYQKGVTCVPLTPLTASFKEAQDSGRAMLFALNWSQHNTAYICVLYGKQGGAVNEEAANVTDNLAHATLNELQQRPLAPTFTCTDLNANVADIPIIQHLCTREGWADLGEYAYLWGQKPNDFTCMGPNANSPTRRDYVFANQLALNTVSMFKVIHTDDFPVHDILQVHLKASSTNTTYNAIQPTADIAQIHKEHCNKACKNVQNKKEQQKIKGDIKQQLHKHITDHIHNNTSSTNTNDLTLEEFWTFISTTLSEAFNSFYRTDNKTNKQIASKGRINTKQVQTHNITIDKANHTTHNSNMPESARRCNNLSKKISAIVTRYKALAKGTTGTHRTQLEQLNKDALANAINTLKVNIQHQTDSQHLEQDNKLMETLRTLQAAATSPANQYKHFHRHIPTLRLQATRLYNLHTTIANQAQNACKAHKSDLQAAYKATRTNNPPLTFIKDTSNKDGPPRYITERSQIDDVIIKAWTGIRKGNVEDHQALVTDFVNKYAEFIHNAEEFPMEDVTGEQLQRSCRKAKPTSASLDAWTTSEFKLLPLAAFDLMAVFLNRVEGEGRWPNNLTIAKAVFLYKDDPQNAGPLDLRVLQILPTIYRRWASTRLQQLKPWIETWAEPELFSGIPGQGAEDACYSSAIWREHATANDNHFSGSAADIYKCYDQMSRPLIEVVLTAAGCPSRVVKPYIQCISNLNVYNSIGGHLGKAHQHPCGIPQGCPLSMMVLGLTMRPWILKCRTLNVTPRALADDILTLAQGYNHLQHTIIATEFTFRYLKDIGAKGAPNKSYTFSSCPTSRKYLSNITWKTTNTTIKTTTSTRDLGGHLSTSTSLKSNTLNQRLRDARTTTNKVARIPTTNNNKITIINSKVNAAALYGSETQPIHEQLMAGLRTSIANAIGPKSQRRSINITFANTTASQAEVDPYVWQLTRKIKMLRRCWYKRPQDNDACSQILANYVNNNTPGTTHDNNCNNNLTFSPPPGSPGRAKWDSKTPLAGPIGLLLLELKHVGAAMDKDFTIHCNNEASTNILNIPWNHIHIFATQLATRARTATAPPRNTHQGLFEIDTIALRSTIRKIAQDDLNIHNHLTTGATWDQASKFKAGQDNDHKCPHCHHPNQDIFHTLHACPTFQHIRQAHKALPDNINHTSVPNTVLIGVPPALCLDPTRTFWGQTAAQVGLQHDCIDNKIGIKGTRNLEPKLSPTIWWHIDNMTNNNHKEFHDDHNTNNIHHNNARQLLNSLRKHTQWLNDNTHVPFVNDVAPADINVYTDGSVSNPTFNNWQTGGCAAWYNEARSNFTGNEQQFTCNTNNTSSNTQATVDDFWYSSTRMEIAGLILACLSPGPIHVGTDNQAVVRKARKILASPHGRPPKPWGLTPDGDLWQWFHQIAQTRGPHSIDISKVKGHTTQEMVDSGTIRQQDKFGNDNSDHHAKTANASSIYHDLAIACASRQQEYNTFMQGICNQNISIYKVDAKLREQQLRITKATQGKSYKMQHIANSLPFPQQSECRPLQVHPCDFWPNEFNNYSSVACMHVWTFLSLLLIKPTTPGTPGITWLELLILYNIRGGTLDFTRNQANPTPKARSTKAVLSDFQAITRRTIKFFMDDEDATFFKASPSTDKRLSALGFNNHAPKTNFTPYATPEEITQICHALLSTRPKFNNNMKVLLANASLYLVSMPLKLRPAPKWAAHIKTDNTIGMAVPPTPTNNNRIRPTCDNTTLKNAREFIDNLVLRCSSCNQPKPHKHIMPFHNNKWHIIKCNNNNCNKAQPAKAWHCQCNKPWRACSTHSTWTTHAATIHLTNIHDTRQAGRRKQQHNLIPQLQGKRHNTIQPRLRAPIKTTQRQQPSHKHKHASPSAPSTGAGPETNPVHSYVFNHCSASRGESQSKKRKGDQAVTIHGEERAATRSRPLNSQPSSSSRGNARKRPSCQGPSSHLLAKLAAKFPKLNPTTSASEKGDG